MRAEGIAWIWDIGTGQVVQKLDEEWDPHESYSLTDIAFSPDGDILATISCAGWVVLWEVAEGEVLLRLEGCQGRKASISFSSDGRLLGAGSYEGAMIWDVKTKECLVAQFYPDSVIESAGWDAITKPALLSDELDHLAVRTEDEKVEVVFIERIKSGWSERTFYGHRGNVTSACFSHDGSLVATGSKDHTARVWSLFTGHNDSISLWPGEGEVQCLAFSHDGTTALAGFRDEDGTGMALLWDVTSHEILPQAFFNYYGWVESVAFSSDDQKVAIGGYGGAIIWDVKNERELASLSDPNTRGSLYQGLEVNSLCFSPDNRRIAIGCDGMVKIWDVQGNRIVANLLGHRQAVKHVMFSSDGTKLVTGSTDGTVRVWDALNYTSLVIPKSHTEDIYSQRLQLADSKV